MIGDTYNYSNIFFRNLLLGFMKNFREQIKQTYEFTSGKVDVVVPIYYSLAGDVRQLYDAFIDDPTTCRFEADYKKVPIAVITRESTSINSSQLTNPNSRVRIIVEDTDTNTIKEYYSKVKAIPIKVDYKLTCFLNSELDEMIYFEKMLTQFHNYKFFTFYSNGLKIDAVFTMPDTFNSNIPREIASTDQRIISVDITFSVDTYYPVFDYKTNDIYGKEGFIGADKLMTNILHNVKDAITEETINSEWIPNDPEEGIDLDGDDSIDYN